MTELKMSRVEKLLSEQFKAGAVAALTKKSAEFSEKAAELSTEITTKFGEKIIVSSPEAAIFTRLSRDLAAVAKEVEGME